MDSTQYRVFVCTKKRPQDDPEGCCCNSGALNIYQAFESEINRLQLSDRVIVRKSGCLDRCESGVVAMICQPQRSDFGWLPTKIRVKLRKLLFPNRHLYGNLTPDDVQAIAQSHLVNDKPLKKCQLSQQNKH